MEYLIAIALWCGIPNYSAIKVDNHTTKKDINECRKELIQKCPWQYQKDIPRYIECFSEAKLK